jgi:transposase-like protein
MTCRHCGSRQLIHLKKENRYHCKQCRKKSSVFSSTWLRHVKIPLVMFLNIFVAWIQEYPVQRAALVCGTSQVTVRRYYHLFRVNVVKSVAFEPQDNVQVDEAYFGQFKKISNFYHGYKKYELVDKVCVAGISCPKTGMLATRVIRTFPKTQPILAFIREFVPPNVTVYSDGSAIYNDLHRTHFHVSKTHDQGFHNAYFIEGCWSHLKRKLFKIYHHFDRKYSEEYIAEMTWRFNTRKSPKNPWQFLVDSF